MPLDYRHTDEYLRLVTVQLIGSLVHDTCQWCTKYPYHIWMVHQPAPIKDQTDKQTDRHKMCIESALCISTCSFNPPMFFMLMPKHKKTWEVLNPMHFHFHPSVCANSNESSIGDVFCPFHWTWCPSPSTGAYLFFLPAKVLKITNWNLQRESREKYQ